MSEQQILLLGFRGVGKSSVGKTLSQILGWELIDLDTQIQEETQQDIDTLTNQGHNWQAFRYWETRLLARFLGQPQTILVTGGGVGVNQLPIQQISRLADIFYYEHINLNLEDLTHDPESDLTWSQVQSKFIENTVNLFSVLLKADVQALHSRLQTDYHEQVRYRPGIQPSNTQDIETRVATDLELFQERQPLYQQLPVTLTLDTSQKDVQEVSESLSKYFRNSA